MLLITLQFEISFACCHTLTWILYPYLALMGDRVNFEIRFDKPIDYPTTYLLDYNFRPFCPKFQFKFKGPSGDILPDILSKKLMDPEFLLNPKVFLQDFFNLRIVFGKKI